MVTISVALKEKGDRLYNEGRVTRQRGSTYQVQGDTGTYDVFVLDAPTGAGGCNCPAGQERKMCSHLYAACVFEQVDPPPARLVAVSDPFEGLEI